MKKFIAYIFISLAATSCMVDLERADAPPGEGLHFLTGRVLGLPENEPVEHIKVTIGWNNGEQQDVKYTSSEGIFSAELPEGMETPVPVSILMEDIDGQENGGLFESHTDNIIFSMDPDSPIEFLDYRLNRAIASESSPQS